jgi:hypothetical protein
MMFDTPEGVELFGLLVLKGDLKLLSHGIHRRGYNARTVCKKRYGVKTNDIPTLLKLVEAEIAEKEKNPAAMPKSV